MVGLTRQQIAARAKRDAEKEREYYSLPNIIDARVKRAVERQERIVAMGMLLDANWSASNCHFVKKDGRINRYFDEHGEEFQLDRYGMRKRDWNNG